MKHSQNLIRHSHGSLVDLGRYGSLVDLGKYRGSLVDLGKYHGSLVDLGRPCHEDKQLNNSEKEHQRISTEHWQIHSSANLKAVEIFSLTPTYSLLSLLILSF